MADVFPLRNLPTDAEPWGRTVEDRIYQAENALSGSKQSLSGLNRATGSTLENLAYQIQQVQSLAESIPVPQQRSANFTGFGVTGTNGWNPIGSLTFNPTFPGRFSFTVIASGQLVSSSTSTSLQCDFRLVASGLPDSPVVPGLYAFSGGSGVNNFLVNYGWNAVPVGTGPVNITVQARPADGASWGGGTGSYLAVTGYGTFTRG